MAQFVVETDAPPSGRRPIGLVCAYDPNLRNQTVYLSLLAMPAFRATGVMLSAAQLFIDYLFCNWQLRKVYFEVLAFNYAQFSAFGELAEIEGRLSEFEFFDGQWWDLIIGAITRERWARARAQVHAAVASVAKRMEDPLKEDLGVVTLERFVGVLADIAGVDGNGFDVQVTLESRLVDDLGFDSLGDH